MVTFLLKTRSQTRPSISFLASVLNFLLDLSRKESLLCIDNLVSIQRKAFSVLKQRRTNEDQQVSILGQFLLFAISKYIFPTKRKAKVSHFLDFRNRITPYVYSYEICTSFSSNVSFVFYNRVERATKLAAFPFSLIKSSLW